MTHVSVAAQTVLRRHVYQVKTKKEKEDWKCVFLSGLSCNNILSNKIQGETKKKKRKKYVVCFVWQQHQSCEICLCPYTHSMASYTIFLVRRHPVIPS